MKWLCCLALLLLAACAKEEEDPEPGIHDGLSATSAAPLTPANPNASPKDEDPSIITTPNGRFYMAWLSNRDGNDECYTMQSSKDGESWGPPNRITNNADNDWYPTLIAYNGRFHVTWMRQTATTRTVWYNSSPDGVTWNPADEQPVTTGVSDDFVPYLVEVGGVLHVYFDSEMRSSDATRNLFLVQSTGFDVDGVVTGWSAPTELAISSTTESDMMPYIHPRPLGGYLMTWLRHAGSATAFLGFLDATTDINWASSTDGINWTYWGAVMPEDGLVDSMPSFYNAGFTETLTWMREVTGQGQVFDNPFELTSTFPANAVNITTGNGVPGWSPRVTHTHKPGLSLRVWVGESDLRIYRQFFYH